MAFLANNPQNGVMQGYGLQISLGGWGQGPIPQKRQPTGEGHKGSLGSELLTHHGEARLNLASACLESQLSGKLRQEDQGFKDSLVNLGRD